MKKQIHKLHNQHAPHRPHEERVVVTSMSIVSPIAIGIDDFFQALKDGKCGLSKITNYDINTFPIKVAGEIKNEILNQKLDQYNIDRKCFNDRKLALITLALHELLQLNSNRHQNSTDEQMTDLLIGCGISELLFDDTKKIVTKENSIETLLGKSPYIMRTLEDYPAYSLAKLIKNCGLHISNVAACVASTQAIGICYQRIKHGLSSQAIVGGVDSILNPFGMLGFTRLSALSPTEECKPFDLKRNGTLLGEGAALLFLESLSSAIRNGRKVLAEIISYTSTNDAYNMTHPDPSAEAAARAISLTLKKANLKAEDVQYINAHGTGTPLNDVTETKAIKDVFADHAYKLKISSTKSMIGHFIAAAGAAEVVATILTLINDIVFPTINLTTKDPLCDLDYVANQFQAHKVNVALANSFGFGGFNSILALRKFEE
ncbi:MAG: beta-ketoacyl-[acyl-carrier-protein] synthase family protein [Oligoflexia bacterium]|nr:beta-ketoacyl-[acyl-carrier-protein] synthase family protein [Oligoflexia bacterium]